MNSLNASGTGFDIFKAFATDKRSETDGRRLTLRPDADPAKASWLLIARKGNGLYKEALSHVLQENQAMLGTQSAEAEALAQSIFRDAAARHLLIGWQNIDWFVLGAPDPVTGVQPRIPVKNVPYSYEVAREMLEVNDFNKLVDDYASAMSNYRAEEVKKEAKNSSTS